jgi:hypothetical protein
MAARDRIGRERYGVPLATLNGRNHLIDAYQEQLDALVYLRAAYEESQSDDIMSLYSAQMTITLATRTLIPGGI